MRRLLPLALLLAALLSSTALLATGPAAPGIEVAVPAATEPGPSCSRGTQAVAAVFAQPNQTAMPFLPDVRLASGGNPYCDSAYCWGATPPFPCYCGCEAEACYCADACAQNDYFCFHRCRRIQIDCDAGCAGAW